MGIGNSSTKSEQHIQVSGSDHQILTGDTALKQANGTAVQKVMDTAGTTVSKVIESGGDILSAPAIWLKDIQKNWLAYMVVAAIILSCAVFLYCSMCSYFNRKKNNLSNSNLIELAKINNNKNGIFHQPLPLSVLNLPSGPSNSAAEFRV